MKNILLFTLLLLFSLSVCAQVNIGVVERVKSVTTSYSASITDDNILADATSGNITITLPSASLKKGKSIKIIKTDATASTVTVSGKSLASQGNAVSFISTGSSWITTSNYSESTPVTRQFFSAFVAGGSETSNCTSSCTIYRNDGLVSGASRSTVGTYSVSFNGGICTSEPVCQVSGGDIGVSYYNHCSSVLRPTISGGLSIRCVDDTGGTRDSVFGITCFCNI